MEKEKKWKEKIGQIEQSQLVEKNSDNNVYKPSSLTLRRLVDSRSMPSMKKSNNKYYRHLERVKAEIEEYKRNNEVGFYVENSFTKFISTKRHYLNFNWEIEYSKISGVAFANVMKGDDDSLFLIIIRGNEEPIYFEYTFGEEMQGFDKFLEKLENEIGLEEIWGKDKIIIAYPSNLRGKELYKPWTNSIEAFKHEIKRVFGARHHVSGLIKDEFKHELNITK